MSLTKDDIIKRNQKCNVIHGVDWYIYNTLSRRGIVKTYGRQRENAKKRNISWEFNLASWWKVWVDSGKWAQRGKGSGRYVMARKGDTGSYNPSNIEIITHNKNNQDWMNRRHIKDCFAVIISVSRNN